jgi:hypothetical protein
MAGIVRFSRSQLTDLLELPHMVLKPLIRLRMTRTAPGWLGHATANQPEDLQSSAPREVRLLAPVSAQESTARHCRSMALTEDCRGMRSATRPEQSATSMAALLASTERRGFDATALISAVKSLESPRRLA